MDSTSTSSGLPCLDCQGRQIRKRFFRSRKFWCVVLGTSIPPSMWGWLELPPLYVALMMFPPMAWGFGEWMLDFVKELTKLLKAWSEVRALMTKVPVEAAAAA
jgi:hypothetical protein